MKIFFIYIFVFFNFIIISKASANKNQKIVSLAPNLTEIVYALGLGNQLVGNTILCDYPEQAKKVYKVGNFNNPNMERIISSGTNIVLATEGNPMEKLNALKTKGIKIVQVKPQKATDIPIIIQTIANNLGVSEKGKELSSSIEKSLQKISIAVL